MANNASPKEGIFDFKKFETELRATFTQVDDFLKLVKVITGIGESSTPPSKNPYAVLYGPGGYGKTEMTELLFKHLVQGDFGVIPLSNYTTGPDLLGGYDMERMLKTGEVVEAIQRSVFARKAFVLEEGFQATTDTLNILKYLLTSGVHCADGTCYKLPCKYGFINTNSDPVEWANTADRVSESLAFLERFPYQMTIVWKDHSQDAYYSALRKKYAEEEYKKVIEAVSLMASEAHKRGNTMSPRLVIKDLFPAYLVSPEVAISCITGIAPATKTYLLDQQKEIDKLAVIMVKLTKTMELSKLVIKPGMSYENKEFVLKGLQTIKEDLKKVSISYGNPDDFYEKYKKANEVVDKKIELFRASMQKETFKELSVDELLGFCNA